MCWELKFSYICVLRSVSFVKQNTFEEKYIFIGIMCRNRIFYRYFCENFHDFSSIDSFYLNIYEHYISQNQHAKLMPNGCCACFDFLHRKKKDRMVTRNAFRWPCSRTVAHNFSKRHVRYLACHDHIESQIFGRHLASAAAIVTTVD